MFSSVPGHGSANEIRQRYLTALVHVSTGNIESRAAAEFLDLMRRPPVVGSGR